MKKSAVFAIITALLLSLYGCAPSVTDQHLPEPEQPVSPSAEYKELYSGTLDHFRSVILSGADAELIGEGETGVLEIVSSMEQDDALNSIGYSIEDISGDDIPELIIAAIPMDGDSLYYGSQLLAVYTLVDDVPFFSFEGWARSRYVLLDNNDIFNSGSGGAMYSCFGTFHLYADGTALECSEFYFTDVKGESSDEIGFYFNTTGDWDPALSTELELSSHEFFDMQDAMLTGIRSITLTPFSELR